MGNETVGIVSVPTVLLLGTDRLGVSLSALGGKGSALADMISAGLPIPKTGVITTEAYSRAGCSGVVEKLGLASGDSRLSDSDIDGQFKGLELERQLELELLRLVREVGDGGPVAIRSSATAEDLSGASFAGQYRSLLNVDSGDRQEVLGSIRAVWASLWHAAPVAYRSAFVSADAEVKMAVVVMAMVPATSAGVVFTQDPGGLADHCRVEAVEGLGEALVSGSATPQAWVVPRRTSLRPRLPPEIRFALDLALEIESLFGSAQDVEWAAVGDDVLVVQARPITVLEDGDGFDSEPDNHELTTAGIVEMVPGVLPALVWELNHYLLEEAFRSFLDTMEILHGSKTETRWFIRRVRGRAALDFDQLRTAASEVSVAAPVELEEKYFGSSDWSHALEPAGGRRSPLRVVADLRDDLRAMSARARVTQQADVVIHAVEGLPGHEVAITSLDDVALMSYIERLVDLAARGLAAELGVAAAAADAYQRLESQLERHVGAKEAQRQAQLLTAGSVVTNRTSSASAAVFAGPTWNELGRTPPSFTLETPLERRRRRDVLDQRLRSLPGWTQRRWLTGQFVDIRMHLLHRAVANATSQLQRREATKAAVLTLGGEVRVAHLEVGARLVARGVLDRAVDIELLTTTEIARALHTGTKPGQLRRRRNWIRRHEAEGPLPVRFTGTPQRLAEPLPEGDVLTGWASSPGRYEGRARVVLSPSGGFEDGEVLVAATTDASWSPLFLKAGAVVVEQGGPLSHAAILARELGLPAVLNIAGATRRLSQRWVTVDGDAGSVVISPDEEDLP
ncbi:MAG: PEP/pyruvate-binding domain-containing protein [Acidimicrobiales bacterium]